MGTAETYGSVERHGGPQDPGRYEERFRLNWAAARAGMYFAILCAGGAKAIRSTGSWRVDRERLAAVIAVVAPGVFVTDTPSNRTR